PPLAVLPVGRLAGTGVYQYSRGLASWDARRGTPCGEILTAKLVAVALLLAAAGLSRRWTGRLARAQARAEEAVTVPERVPELVTAGGAGGPALAAAASPSGADTARATGTAADGDPESRDPATAPTPDTHDEP